ncbi:lipoate--protein ligase [Mycoplasmopsis cynos]|uniref:lipoate--protein ligase n=1 Tax=Mycoplasmopsis cynos TaxID=171284 RepID=UPI002AFEDE48|nr:lipoate--protein ligase [Mycoplasmopsis cynos]WQQ15530.1 lipoate--protein ligase [Mycoplasmopsis cynos]WQQ15858.1 lipoate--protein ligase [Mycoplasmopsis cynos]
MKIYICKNHFSPFYTLTLEEIMTKDDENKEDIIYLYQHENAVIIGRNQNAYKEVRFDILEKENIELYRRLSGGGAVYHDLGNFNFSFITTNKSQRSYQKFLEPVLEFLKLQGLDAQFKGRNDLVVNDCKFSGNAQFIYKDKIVHHGTILYNANLSKLASVLNPSKIKMESKGIKSARQRVINLSDVLEQKIPTSEFIWKFALFLKEKYHAEIVEIPEKYIKKIPEVQKIRSSKEWVLGKNPEFSFFSEKKLDGGILGINANVKENKITQIKFEGDFLTLLGTEYIEKLLINQDFEKANIKKILLMVENLENYFGQISVNEIIDIMFGE